MFVFVQFLVSKLVACCIPSENNPELHVMQSSRVLSLLHQLTVDADPALYDCIKVQIWLLLQNEVILVQHILFLY